MVAEPMGAFNRDPRDLVVYTSGDSLVVNPLLESCAARESFGRPWEGSPPYPVPEGTFIDNSLIMLTHNHEARDGSHFLFVPSSSSGFRDPWVERAAPFKRGTTFVF